VQEYILDACAVLAFLDGEEGAIVVRRLLDQARTNEISLIMNVANLVEVYYDRIRTVGIKQADEIIQNIYDTFPISFIENLSPDIVREASILKAEGKMSFADTILVATAICTNTTIVTCDHSEFEMIEKQEAVPILWIRQ